MPLPDVNVVLDNAKTKYGVFSGLKSKKFSVTFIIIVMAGSFMSSVVDVNPAAAVLAFLGACFVSGCFVLGQSYSDGKQAGAIAAGAATSSVKSVED